MIVTIFSTQRPSRAHSARTHLLHSPPSAGFTLVEMLIAISITLVMMAVVVGVFATLSESVAKRRSAIEVGNQLRHVRNVLQRDLEGATCPVIPWQRPESDVGYFEIVEGPYADFYPSLLTDDRVNGVANPSAIAPEIDHAISTIPSSNVSLPNDWVTDGGGLGDHDDVLAFTSRNEKEPFTGPAPLGNAGANGAQNPFIAWASQSISSPVAEVVWFCMENPPEEYDALSSFGEEGFRTIYRRTLLVAPWLDYRYDVGGGPKSRPGVLRILDRANVTEAQALAALISFQERYDISARINFDPTIRSPDGRWTIVANTLADLTDRKNRFEHHGYIEGGGRRFPYVMVSKGYTTPTPSVRFYADPEAYPSGNAASGAAATLQTSGNSILGVQVTTPSNDYIGRPFVAVEGGGTVRAMANENGRISYVTTGLVPLGVTGQRTTRVGADLMLSDALAFDVQVFDPNAPVYALDTTGTAIRRRDNRLSDPNLDFNAVGPGSAGWWRGFAQFLSVNDPDSDDNPIVVREGAYVDLGYVALQAAVNNASYPTVALSTLAGLPNNRSLPADSALTRVYDTWNFGYENDGVNQDGDSVWKPDPTTGQLVQVPYIDEGTDGFDVPEVDVNGDNRLAQGEPGYFGPDDPAERETSPPYPVPLRAVQVKLRAYEPDSRQMREVTVRQHFVPE